MTLDEAIETLKIAKAEVEWEYPLDYAVAIDMVLEKLKFLQYWKTDIIEKLCKYDCNSVEEVAHNAYNKAIDDFLKLCSYKTFSKYENEDGYMSFNNISLMLKDLSDKLKGVSK